VVSLKKLKQLALKHLRTSPENQYFSDGENPSGFQPMVS
jgi:hypothetical protein